MRDAATGQYAPLISPGFLGFIVGGIGQIFVWYLIYKAAQVTISILMKVFFATFGVVTPYIKNKIDEVSSSSSPNGELVEPKLSKKKGCH